MKIKELEKEQRPREKALRFGFDVLTNQELIALLLSSGTKKRNVFEVADDVLKETHDLTNLFDLRPSDLMTINGIREVKALQLLASVELSKRALRAQAYQTKIESPTDLIKWFEVEYGHKTQENFVAVFLDSKGCIITHKVMFIGTLNQSCIHPRNIFKEAFMQNANSVMVVHNHPSGDPHPSNADIQCTKQLKEVAKMMGIQLLDHLIVGKNSWFSFRQAQYLD